MRYFLHISYDGTRYHGWQIQPNGVSVEGEVERCLSIILRKPIDIVGAGRTDAGVHARHLPAHFDVEEPIEDCDQLTYRLNRILPKDICVTKTELVADDLHARFSATSRTYHYYIHTFKSPFHNLYSWECHYNLDFEAMNKAAEMLLEHDDFATFCKSHSDVKTTLCKVSEARWIRQTDGSWYFRITANRFLRNMVRAVVGTLVEVGRGRMTISDFQKALEGRSRTLAGESMPGNALFLEKVCY